jgi:hypothetical protein
MFDRLRDENNAAFVLDRIQSSPTHEDCESDCCEMQTNPLRSVEGDPDEQPDIQAGSMVKPWKELGQILSLSNP